MPEDVRILVVEDDADQRTLVGGILRSGGFWVDEASSYRQAIERLERAPVDLVVSDWKLPGGDAEDGVALLARVRDSYPGTAFIMITAYGTISHAVEAVRAGADDYLPKPFERQALFLAAERALRSRRLEVENRRLSAEANERERLVDLVGRSAAMQKVYRQVEKLAGTDATVLVTGESGTGKELAARALHQLSPRRAEPFVAVNCAAIPEGLIESEFFGVEKGAFTGADRSRPGKFQVAGGGTLFLDEIGELPLPLQPKLLRVLQEGRFTRVGGSTERDSAARIITATNRDLGSEVREGRFREDLYYRLNVVAVEMPPLRSHREDIPLLIEHLTERFSRRHGRRLEPFGSALMRHLIEHSWPGNVRQLANVVERLVLLAEGGRARLDDLPDEMTRSVAGDGGFSMPAEGLSWDDHERDLLSQALDLAAGNRARAARLLDLPYKAFLYRLSKHDLDA